MKPKYRLKLNLQLFSDDMGAAPGVESAPAAEVQSTEGTEPTTGVDPTAAAEQKEPNNFEKAFAKRLAAEKAKWEQDTKQKYGDYEVVKEVADYFREANGVQDFMSLKERIEMERLQERAETNNLSPEAQKRMEELEAKANKFEEMMQAQEQSQQTQAFEHSLKEFCADKGVDHLELWTFMHENSISKPEIALKAMKADEAERKAQEREQDIIKRYLESKQAPKSEGSGAPGMTSFKPTGNIESASQRALERFRAAKQPS